jgi:hypothetical protein
MPVSINLLPDEVIARGITGADWGKGFEGYFAGQEQAQKQALQNLFRGGLPRTAQGDIDYGAAAEQIARISGAASIPMLNQLREFELAERGLRGLESAAPQVFGPVTPQQPRAAPAPTSAIEPDVGGVPARPGQANLVQPGETGFKVDYGPVTTSYASGREETQPDTRYPREFSATPVTGPPTGQFTSVSQVTQEPPPEPPPSIQRTTPARMAQAQAPRPEPVEQRPAPPPPPAQPLIPLGAPGFFSEENAQAYERAAARANYVATWLGAGKMAPAAAGPKQQAEQHAATAKQIREAIAKRQEHIEQDRLRREAVMPEAVAKQAVEQLAESRKEASNIAKGIPVTQDLLDQINSKSGIFTGKWANERLALAKVGQAFGIPDDRITPTETYRATIGRRVAQTVKNFGSGTSITNQDREYAERMEGGDIALDESSIRQILTLADRGNRDTLRLHNQAVDALQRDYPGAKFNSFKIKEPAALKGRTTEPKPGPAGAIPPAPDAGQREVNKVYQTPKGPYRWLGNGWGPP